LLISLLFSNCKSNNDFLFLNGELLTNQIRYKNGYLDGKGYPYSIYFDHISGYMSFEQKDSIPIKAKYKVYYEKNGEISLDLSNANDKRINGNYMIEIDTILKSKQRDEILITIQSNEIYFKSGKTIVKTLGI